MRNIQALSRSARSLLLSPFLAFCVPAHAGAWGFGRSAEGDPADAAPRKIVVFDAAVAPQARGRAVERHGGRVLKHLEIIHAAAAALPDGRVQDLLREPGVRRVDEDIVLEALVVRGSARPGGGGGAQPPQQIPWGVARIKAPDAWGTSRGAAVKVAILDTGVDVSHPDLLDNLKGGINTINLLKSHNDDNGHGTHVAGIVAALNNSIGVVGAGPLIHLYAVKALGRNGTGFLSDIIEGLQWSAANGMRVVNMSLGSSSDNQSFHDAVAAAHNAGVTLVAAAGNSGGGAVSYPARYPEVIAVAASDSSDQFASFSSRGPEVDLIAPGSDVFSTYMGKAYATLSGTSMAAPHATGAAALRIALNPSVTPAEVAAALAASADPLPGLSADQQGAGLVDCLKLLAAP